MKIAQYNDMMSYLTRPAEPSVDTIGGGIIQGEDLGDRTGFKEPKTSIRRGVVEDYSKPGSSIPAIRQIKKGENEGKWAYRKSGRITGYYDSEKEAKEAQKKAKEEQYEGAKKPFTEKEIREVKKLRSEGKTIEQIVKESGINSRQRVLNILRSEGLTSKRGGSSKFLENKDNLKYVQENYKKLKRSTIGENLFPDVSPSIAYDRAGKLIAKLSEEGKIDTSGTKFSEEYIEEAGLKKVPKKEQDRLKGKKRYRREKAVGGKGYKDHLIGFKKEVAEALDIPKVKRKGSSLTSSDFTPIDMAHRADMDFLKLINDPIRAEDFGPDFYNINRKSVKKLENKLEPLYLQQSKLLKKAKKFDKVPKELQTQINNNNIKILDSFEEFPEIASRIKPITINPKDLSVFRGVKDVTKELGVGLVDKAMQDIKIGSEEDIIIKANLAEQIKSEALEAGLLKNKKTADKKLDKFFKKETIDDLTTQDILQNVASGRGSQAGFMRADVPLELLKGAGQLGLKALGPLGTVAGTVGIEGALAAGRPIEETVKDPLTGLALILPEAGKNVVRNARLANMLNLGMKASTLARMTPIGLGITGAQLGYKLYEKGQEQKAMIDAMTPYQKELFESEMEGQAFEGEAAGFKTGGPVDKKSKKDLPGQPDPNLPINPSRRDFLEGSGALGLGALLAAKGFMKFGPEIKKTAQAAKVSPLTKVVAPLGKTETDFPQWFPGLINKVRKEGTQTPIYDTKLIGLSEAEYSKLSKEEAKKYSDSFMARTDEYIQQAKAKGEPRYYKFEKTDEIIGYQYQLKDRPDLKVSEYRGEDVYVEFPNDYGGDVLMEYQAPKGTKDAQFSVSDARPMGHPDDVEFDYDYVENIDEVYGGASGVEQYALGSKKRRYTQGDEVAGRGDAMLENMKDIEGDLD